MHAHRILSSLIVTAVLVTCGLGTVASAQTRAVVKAGPVTLRVYDRSHKDYHEWTSDEDRTYRQYLGDQHMKYRPIAKLSTRQQTNYWNSRHASQKR